MLNIIENQTLAQANSSNLEKYYVASPLQNTVTDHSLWKYRQPFLEQSYRLLRRKRHASAAKEVLGYFLTVCDNNTGIIDKSIETICYDLGCSARNVKYGTQLLEELGILDKKIKGFKQNNIYFLNIESLGTRPVSTDGQTICPQSTNNNNTKEKIYFGSKRKWIEPEPLPPDFNFSVEEKQIIEKTYHVEPGKVTEAFLEWKEYNQGRLGFNWFQSFNGFCARRKWYKQSFKRSNRFVPLNLKNENQTSFQAQIAERSTKVAEKMKSYKKKYPKKQSLPDQMDIIKTESEYDAALIAAGVTNIKDRQNQIKNIMRQTYYGYT